MNEVPDVVWIWLLGGFSVTVGSGTIEEGRWSLKKAAALVKLLALAPGHRLHRERLMDLLWPGLGKRAASNNLRRALHAARAALGAEAGHRYLVSEDGLLALCPGGKLWVDVDAFERAAAMARHARDPAAYRAAIELYAGELLPEDRYEAWAEERREGLRQLYFRLLLEVAALYEELGDYERGVEALRRAVGEDPVLEEAHAGLMRLHALSGRRGQALAQYGRLAEALSGRLGARPAEATCRLRKDIEAGRFPPSATPTADLRRVVAGETPVGGKHNLPLRRTSFVGRDGEMVEVRRLLSMTHLLTLTGAGGSGKTRLALEVARDMVACYRDGVRLVELAPLSEGELVPQGVARSLGVREQPGLPLAETLAKALSRKQMLLVLDNCEHLADPVARLLDALLDSCPSLRVLATSREPLRVDGEVLLRVSSLSVPAARPSAAEDLTRYESVRLFRERARLKLPAFDITPENAHSVVEVCRRLDGIPLAIELATARMGAMAVEQVAGRLEDSLELLTGGTRTASPRQQTMRATIEWSHRLLSEEEKELFERISVFAGGYSLEAAEAVVPGGGIAPRDVSALVSALVEKSLLLAEPSPAPDGLPRYRMPEPVRRYARERLEEGGEAASVSGRHAAFFLRIAEEAEPHLKGPDQTLWLERLTREHDNLRAAMRWLLDVGEHGTVSRFGWALYLFWWIRSHFAEGRRWMEEGLAKGHAMPPRDRARALYVAGTMAAGQAEGSSAWGLAEESRRLFEELGDEEGVALSVGTLGIAAASQKRYEEGIALLGEAAALHAGLGYEWECAAITVMLAGAHLGLGDHERAAQKAEEGLALARKVGDALAASAALHVLATVASASGDRERAKGLFGEGLRLAAELGDEANVVYYLEELGAVSASEGELRRAARLWGAAEALLGTTEATAYPHRSEGALHLSRVAAARARLEEGSWAAAWSEGSSMSPERAVAYALSAEAPAPSRSRGDCRRPRKDGPPTGDAVADGPPADGPPPGDVLTRREREVADLVARGFTNREISSELSISNRTVETHVRNVLGKLGLRSRTQLAARAVARGSTNETRG